MTALVSNANCFCGSLDSQIKTGDGEQPFRIAPKFRFDILRGLERCVSLTAHVQVHRDLRNDSRKELIRDIHIGFVDGAKQLFDSTGAVSIFQLLIAECCMRADQ